MIESLGWTTLEDRRNKHRAVMLYKIIHGIVEVQSHTYLTPTPSPHHTRGHRHRFQQLPTRVDSYKYSFFPDTLKIQGRSQEFNFTEARLKGKGASNAGGLGAAPPRS